MADFQILPTITDTGRLALRNLIDSGGPSFTITHAAVGTGGYSPSNPFSATPPDPAAVSLENEIFRTAQVLREDKDAFTRVYVCALGQGEAIGALGEAGLFATWTSGADAGNLFLFALVHFGARSKTANESIKIKMPILT
jgi:hypothetical protein